MLVLLKKGKMWARNRSNGGRGDAGKRRCGEEEVGDGERVRGRINEAMIQWRVHS